MLIKVFLKKRRKNIFICQKFRLVRLYSDELLYYLIVKTINIFNFKQVSDFLYFWE